jgi:hypothetical protein
MTWRSAVMVSCSMGLERIGDLVGDRPGVDDLEVNDRPICTTKLSSVITGWGANDTTCSRRSISGLRPSATGRNTAKPGSRVRW